MLGLVVALVFMLWWFFSGKKRMRQTAEQHRMQTEALNNFVKEARIDLATAQKLLEDSKNLRKETAQILEDTKMHRELDKIVTADALLREERAKAALVAVMKNHGHSTEDITRVLESITDEV